MDGSLEEDPLLQISISSPEAVEAEQIEADLTFQSLAQLAIRIPAEDHKVKQVNRSQISFGEIKKCREFVNRNYFACALAGFVTSQLMHDSAISVTLLLDCLQCDLTRDLVRNVHKLLPTNCARSLSQFDLVLILGHYHLLLDILPHQFGVQDYVGYESYIQYVGCIGKLLGIQDRFNFCLITDSEVRKHVSKRILQRVASACQPSRPRTAVELYSRVAVTDVLGVPANQHLSFFNRFVRKMLACVMWSLKYRPVAFILNFLLEIAIWIGISDIPDRPDVRKSDKRNRSLLEPTVFRKQPPCLFV